jgi:multiple sugar transport system substrate-binding protein
MMRRQVPKLAALAGILALGAGAQAQDKSAADVAVEAAKQYAGTTLNITWEGGLQALDPLNYSGPKWEELTGIKINVVEVPINELFTKTLAEHRAGTGAYDMLNVVPAWIPDLAEAGVLEPLDEYVDKYGYRAELEDIAPVYRDNQMTYQGTIYGLPDDGDVFLMYYRKDLFDDPQHQEAFKAQHGRDLAPPSTWEEFAEVGRYFTEATGGDVYGAGAFRQAGLVHYFWEERFRINGGRFFDPDSMQATINSEAGVKTLQQMIDEHEWMPPGVETWGAIENLSAWLAGDLAMTEWWPPPGRWSEGYGTDTEALSWVPESQIAGQVGYFERPGGHPELAAGFSLAVSSNSRNKEAAYLFAQWLNSKEISLERVMLPYALRDPFRTSHFESEEYKSLWPYADEYLAILQKGAETGLLDLSIRNTFAYEESLTRAITAAFAGEDPQAALDQAAQEWDALTEQVGVDVQRAAYQDWASKPNAYPPGT